MHCLAASLRQPFGTGANLGGVYAAKENAIKIPPSTNRSPANLPGTPEERV
jgi:hypothetical protein